MGLSIFDLVRRKWGVGGSGSEVGDVVEGMGRYDGIEKNGPDDVCGIWGRALGRDARARLVGAKIVVGLSDGLSGYDGVGRCLDC